MAHYLKRMRIKVIHFAWDRYEDKGLIVPKLEMFKRYTQWDRRKMMVYVLVNFGTTFEQDLERVYTIRELGYDPFIMIYDKDKLESGHRLKQLQRWVNSKFVFQKVKTFEEYQGKKKKKDFKEGKQWELI